MTVADYAARRRSVLDQLARVDAQLAAAEAKAGTAAAGKQVVTAAAVACQQAAYVGVAACVTRCLAAVFGPAAYRCELEVRSSRGRPECRFRFAAPDGTDIDPLTAGAGGEVDVIAFALRVAAVSIARPPGRRLLVADEPFKHLSRDHCEAAKEMILSLAKDLDMQVVFSTHSTDLMCGRIEQF